MHIVDNKGAVACSLVECVDLVLVKDGGSEKGEMCISVVDNVVPAAVVSRGNRDMKERVTHQSAMSASPRVNGMESAGVCVVTSVAVIYSIYNISHLQRLL